MSSSLGEDPNMVQSAESHSLGGHQLNAAALGRGIQSRAQVQYSNISNHAAAMSMKLNL